MTIYGGNKSRLRPRVNPDGPLLVIYPGGVHSNASTGFRTWPPGLVDGCREKRLHVGPFDCIDTIPIQ